MPPTGAPAPTPSETAQPVQIPKSNKFKPVNNLKKLLETKVWGADESPSLGMPEHSSPNVKDWIDKHPAFAKTYFKPEYQDALKASLGDANYAKLLYHMPKEHHQSLTTHVQHPAPNSNKFKTPANVLTKLVAQPGTTAADVASYLGTPQGQTFAKSYLHNPSYQDALKGHMGEQAYAALQKHLQAPAQPKKTQEQKEQEIGDAFAPAGLQVKPEDQFFHDHVDTPDTAPGLHGWPGDEGPHHNQYTDPSKLKKNEPVAPEDQDEINQIKQQIPPSALDKVVNNPNYSPVQNEQPPLKAQPATPHPNARIPQGGRCSTSSSTPRPLPTMCRRWLAKHHPELHGGGHRTPSSRVWSPASTRSGCSSPARPPPHCPDWGDKTPSFGDKLEALNAEHGTSFMGVNWDALLKEQPEKAKTALQNAMGSHPELKKPLQGIYDEHFGDADEIAQIKQQMPPATPQAKKGLADLAQMMHTQHGYVTDVDDYKKWEAGPDPGQIQTSWTDPNAAQADFDNFLDHYYEEGQPHTEAPPVPMPSKPQTVTDAQGTPYTVIPGPGMPGYVPPAPKNLQHPALAQGIKKIFPTTALDLDNMSDEDMKHQLEQWKLHLSDTPGLEAHHQQITDLYDKFFGEKAPLQTQIETKGLDQPDKPSPWASRSRRWSRTSPRPPSRWMLSWRV